MKEIIRVVFGKLLRDTGYLRNKQIYTVYAMEIIAYYNQIPDIFLIGSKIAARTLSATPEGAKTMATVPSGFAEHIKTLTTRLSGTTEHTKTMTIGTPDLRRVQKL